MSLDTSCYTRLFSKMEEGVLIIDKDWRILFANEMARRYLNISPENDRIQEDLIQKLSGSYALSTEIEGMVQDKALVEKSMAFEAVSIPDLMCQVRLSIYVSRPTSEGERFMLVRDVTEERNYEICKDRLLSIISHKLLTPLSVAKMSLHNLADNVFGELPDNQAKAVNTVLLKLAGLENSVLQLIKYSSAQKGEAQKPAEETIDAVTTAKDYFDGFKAGRKTDIRFGAVINQAKNTRIRIDRDSFETVLECVLDNAVKFHKEGAVNIDIMFAESDKGLCMKIHDDGPGIPPAIQKKVFMEFVQRDDDFTGNAPGLGLGLPFVKNLLKLYGGNIDLASDQGGGTTVFLTFLCG